jgi:hypothetical protein
MAAQQSQGCEIFKRLLNNRRKVVVVEPVAIAQSVPIINTDVEIKSDIFGDNWLDNGMLNPPAPIELVKASDNEVTSFVLVTNHHFTLSTIQLPRTESVKALEEETPKGFSLVGAKTEQVKASQDEPATIAPPPQAGPPPVFDLSDSESEEISAPATEIIGAEKEYQVGDLIELWVKPTESPQDLISVNYAWTVLPAIDFKTWPDQTRILFGTGSTNNLYQIVLTASYVFSNVNPDGTMTSIEQRSVTTMATVQVGDGKQPTDAQSTGLANLANSWVAQVNRTDDYKESDIKSDANRLAVSFRSIADQIKEGKLSGLEQILSAAKTSNDGAVGSRKIEWLPWFNKMSEYLQESHSNQILIEDSQFQQAWIDIADGLESASQ